MTTKTKDEQQPSGIPTPTFILTDSKPSPIAEKKADSQQSPSPTPLETAREPEQIRLNDYRSILILIHLQGNPTIRKNPHYRTNLVILFFSFWFYQDTPTTHSSNHG